MPAGPMPDGPGQQKAGYSRCNPLRGDQAMRVVDVTDRRLQMVEAGHVLERALAIANRRGESGLAQRAARHVTLDRDMDENSDERKGARERQRRRRERRPAGLPVL